MTSFDSCHLVNFWKIKDNDEKQWILINTMLIKSPDIQEIITFIKFNEIIQKLREEHTK